MVSTILANLEGYQQRVLVGRLRMNCTSERARKAQNVGQADAKLGADRTVMLNPDREQQDEKRAA